MVRLAWDRAHVSDQAALALAAAERAKRGLPPVAVRLQEWERKPLAGPAWPYESQASMDERLRSRSRTTYALGQQHARGELDCADCGERIAPDARRHGSRCMPCQTVRAARARRERHPKRGAA
jgi:hypothetical protein